MISSMARMAVRCRTSAPAMASFSSSAHRSSAQPELKSFCMQCEQTDNGTGCSASVGVCGKTPEVSAMQDLFIHQLQGISQYANEARKHGVRDTGIEDFVLEGMFSTLTNVNFSHSDFQAYLTQGENVRARARAMYEKAGGSDGKLGGAAALDLSGILNDRAALEAKGLSVGVLARKAAAPNEDVHGLAELTLYGLKGMMAYTAHARTLGQPCSEVREFGIEAMAALADANANHNASVPDMLNLALRVGETNYHAMAALDEGHHKSFGTPAPCDVRTSAVKGKAILVSGHDIHDLLTILEKTKGTGINVYTHGEMLPANAYPALKAHKHLIGNWGGPWQLQKMEFSRFPGAIVMTSNCITEPQRRYRDRIFTRRFVGWEGIPKVADDWSNFDAVIAAAQAAPGFLKDEAVTSVPAGFGHKAIVSLAAPILESIKTGDIKRFFVIGGCDGSEGERSYFRDVALNVPNDSVVLTMGCGKYRFNREKFAPTKAGIPRMLDLGQCNDAYGALQVAIALAGALDCKVTDLPLSFAVSWFEQKAVAVLLTLLHLNLKNIYLGPNLPAFVTPNMLKILVDTYGVRGINSADYESDLKQMIAGK